jgi:hypothetical protein
MTLKRLEAILMPPARAGKPADPAMWNSAERELGTALPDDYKSFVSVFGGGRIDDFLTIYSPFAQAEHVNLVQRHRRDLNAEEEIRKWLPGQRSYDLYPAPGGLLGFGSTDNGDLLFWKTQGPPNGWTISIIEPRGPDRCDFNGSMTEFMTALLSREVSCDIFPSDFPSAHPTFVPVDMI